MSRFISLVFVLAFTTISSVGALSQDKKVFKYGGVATCKACHMTKKSGAQYKIWKAGPHAKALETLKTPEAKAVGKEMGVADPSTSPKCLKCHVTAYTVDAALKGPKLKMAEGIGCESCHGPGSVYKKKKIIAAIYAGELKAADYGLTKPVTKKVCVTCHNEESPSYKKFVFKERVAMIAHPIPKK